MSRRSLSRVKSTAGVAGLAISGLVLATLPAVALSNATWTDTEWTSATQGNDPGLGTLDCDALGLFTTRGAGTFLTANVLGLPLSTIADVSGVEVVNHGDSTVTVDPPTAPEVGGVGSNAYANPLDIAALNAAIAADLTGLLHIPLGANLGALNEYAEGQSIGYSAGASGLVNDSGAVDISDYPTPADIPDSATLNLSSVVAEVLGAAGAAFVDEITELDLRLGAVAASVRFDACGQLWTDDLAASLVRDYLVAGLDLDVESDLVGDLVTAVDDTVTDLEAILNGLTGNASLLSGITTAVGDLLDGLLGALSLGGFTSNLTATFDSSSLNAILTDTYSDTSGVIELDLDEGTIGVDIATLLYGPSGLNGLEPNTELLINATVINNLTAAVTQALGQFVAAVTAELDSILAALTISGTVAFDVVALGTIDVIKVGLTLDGVTLAQLLGNSADPANVTLDIDVLAIVSCPPGVLDVVSLIVCPLVTGIVNAITTGILPAVGTAVLGVLAGPTSELDTTLGVLTDAVTSPIVQLLGFLLNGLLGEDGLASVLVNVQNDPASGNPEPADWGGIPLGQYDVAALRVGVLGLLGANGDLDVVLAKGSVGENLFLP